MKYCTTTIGLVLLFLLTTGCLFENKLATENQGSTPDAQETPDLPSEPVSNPKISLVCNQTQLSENSAALVLGTSATLNCSVNLSQASDSDMTINLNVSGSASLDSDYSLSSSQLSVPSGTLQLPFTISSIDDSSYEPVEVASISIATNSVVDTKYEIEQSQGEVSISLLDDELLTVSAYISSSAYILDEGNSSQRVSWTIEFYSDLTGNPVSLPFDLKFTAVAQNNRIDIASRLTAEIQSVIVPRGSATYTFDFGIINDQTQQPIQFDSIKLISDAGTVFSNNSYLTGYLTLYDDDLPTLNLVKVSSSSTENGGTTTFKVVSNATASSSFQIPITFSGTATPDVDYKGPGGSNVVSSLTIPAGSKESPIASMVLVGDGYYEGSEYIGIAIPTNPSLYSLASSSFNISIVDDVTATPQLRSIELTATTQSNPAAITLNWTGDGPGASYKIYRKLISDPTFPATEMATIAPGNYTYLDSTVVPNVKYEYKIERGSGIAFGYLATGISLAPAHNQGGILLLVENSVASALSAEIAQWSADLADDGFTVYQINVNASDSVTQVKSAINQKVLDSSGTIKTLALFGHVPVPYSGNIAPDGHSDHAGAWPADGYYADLDTQNKWTDTLVNTSSANRLQNRNIPGDGKFDQSQFPLTLGLQIGRVDLKDMPAFSPLTEVDLLRRYLNKNHSFRKHQVVVPTRALFDENFGTYGGGDFFATSMWRSISILVGLGNIAAGGNTTTSDWFTQLRTNSYLFAYGAGGGTYTSVSGIGTTTDFATGPSMAVFNALFGSYFGDWDSTNNVLRAPLAADGLGLTNVWSGRPEWHFHQMATGETIGFSALASMNNANTYAANIYARYVHMGLMGDPTLKAYVMAPATQLVSQINSNTLTLQWTASVDSNVDGYYVYKASNRNGPFTLLTSNPITGLSYDTQAESGTNYYMVRATKPQATLSGGFRNLSSGATIGVSH